MAGFKRLGQKKNWGDIRENETKRKRMEGKREAITKVDWQVLKIKQEIRTHHPRNVGWCWKIEPIHKATWRYFETLVQKESDGNFG